MLTKRGLPTYVGITPYLRQIFGVYLSGGEIAEDEGLKFLVSLHQMYSNNKLAMPILDVNEQLYKDLNLGTVMPKDFILFVYPELARKLGLDENTAPVTQGFNFFLPVPPQGFSYTLTIDVFPLNEIEGEVEYDYQYDKEQMELLLADAKLITDSFDSETQPETGTWAWAIERMEKGFIVRHGKSSVKYMLVDDVICWDFSSEQALQTGKSFLWEPAKLSLSDQKLTDWQVFIKPEI